MFRSSCASFFWMMQRNYRSRLETSAKHSCHQYLFTSVKYILFLVNCIIHKKSAGLEFRHLKELVNAIITNNQTLDIIIAPWNAGKPKLHAFFAASFLALIDYMSCQLFCRYDNENELSYWEWWYIPLGTTPNRNTVTVTAVSLNRGLFPWDKELAMGRIFQRCPVKRRWNVMTKEK